MRIAIVNWSRRRVGGAETYLDTIVPELNRLGHQVAFAFEVDVPVGRERISIPNGAPAWCASELGSDRTLVELQSWKPDLVLCHGLLEPSFEAKIVRLSPSILWAHNYYGTCISGNKSFQHPVVRSCSRRFGLNCILHYYPHRCGGLNPITMWRQYARQKRRLTLLRKYQVIVVMSEHMRQEYLKHGFPPDSVHLIPLPVANIVNSAAGTLECFPSQDDEATLQRNAERCASQNAGLGATEASFRQLLFVGRMTSLKGGHVLLDSVPLVSSSLQQPLRLVFAGDGPERERWERRARDIEAANRRIEIEFVGWVNKERLRELFASTDLLVVPSLWPEPFGLVGPDAGLWGVPAAVFNVGGIQDWLTNGVNGYLAEGDPTAKSLAEAIVKCLSDPTGYERLRRGARKCAERFSLDAHMTLLMPLLSGVAERLNRVPETPSAWEKCEFF